MIIQGGNSPITIGFDAAPIDISVALVNEIAILKQWNLADLDTEFGLEYDAPITQQESQQWEEGPCWIEVKWTDSEGTVQQIRQKDEIIRWTDGTIVSDMRTVVDLTGTTWALNDTITFSGSAVVENYINFFSANNIRYSCLVVSNDAQSVIYDPTSGYSHLAYSNADGWTSGDNIIHITGGNNVTNSTFISWLEANATQLWT